MRNQRKQMRGVLDRLECATVHIMNRTVLHNSLVALFVIHSARTVQLPPPKCGDAMRAAFGEHTPVLRNAAGSETTRFEWRARFRGRGKAPSPVPRWRPTRASTSGGQQRGREPARRRSRHGDVRLGCLLPTSLEADRTVRAPSTSPAPQPPPPPLEASER